MVPIPEAPGTEIPTDTGAAHTRQRPTASGSFSNAKAASFHRPKSQYNLERVQPLVPVGRCQTKNEMKLKRQTAFQLRKAQERLKHEALRTKIQQKQKQQQLSGALDAGMTAQGQSRAALSSKQSVIHPHHSQLLRQAEPAVRIVEKQSSIDNSHQAGNIRSLSRLGAWPQAVTSNQLLSPNGHETLLPDDQRPSTTLRPAGNDEEESHDQYQLGKILQQAEYCRAGTHVDLEQQKVTTLTHSQSHHPLDRRALSQADVAATLAGHDNRMVIEQMDLSQHYALYNFDLGGGGAARNAVSSSLALPVQQQS